MFKDKKDIQTCANICGKATQYFLTTNGCPITSIRSATKHLPILSEVYREREQHSYF